MFKFSVVLAGDDKATDLAGLPGAGAKSKPHHYKQIVQEMEGLPKMKFTEEPFQGFRQTKTHF